MFAEPYFGAEPVPQAHQQLLLSFQELRYPSGTGATVRSAGCSLSTGSCALSLPFCLPSTAWPLARVHCFKCHQKTPSVNRCGRAGNGQETNSISAQSQHKQTSHRIYLRPQFQKLPGLHHFHPDSHAGFRQQSTLFLLTHQPAPAFLIPVWMTESAAMQSAPPPPH